MRLRYFFVLPLVVLAFPALGQTKLNCAGYEFEVINDSDSVVEIEVSAPDGDIETLSTAVVSDPEAFRQVIMFLLVDNTKETPVHYYTEECTGKLAEFIYGFAWQAKLGDIEA